MITFILIPDNFIQRIGGIARSINLLTYLLTLLYRDYVSACVSVCLRAGYQKLPVALTCLVDITSTEVIKFRATKIRTKFAIENSLLGVVTIELTN